MQPELSKLATINSELLIYARPKKVSFLIVPVNMVMLGLAIFP